MAIIDFNSISGINSITAQSNALNFFTATGSTLSVGANVNSTGVSTFNNVTVGGATTALVVTGNARITGILTVGTGSITINPITDSITGVTTLGVTTAYISAVNDGPLSGARNRIINGDMKIFQRGTAATIGASSVYALDRWLFGRESGTESARFTVTKESLTSSDTPFTSDGIINTMKIDITTASGGISASQSHYLTQRIEGFNVSDLAYGTSSAKSCVASFWIKADNKTGTMGVSLYNGGNRSYIQNISVSSSWTKYSLVFPGDTSGSIVDDNTQQLTLSFALSAGSNLQNTANTWVAGFDVATSSQADFTDNTSNNIYITGVQLEVGTVATPFERRSYTQELALCHRYFHRMNTGRFVMGYKRQDSQCAWFYQSPVPMRVSPTPTLTTGGTFTNFQSNFSTTQSSPAVYDYSLNTGNGVFGVNSTWSSTHTFIPSYEGFDISFSSEL